MLCQYLNTVKISRPRGQTIVCTANELKLLTSMCSSRGSLAYFVHRCWILISFTALNLFSNVIVFVKLCNLCCVDRHLFVVLNVIEIQSSADLSDAVHSLPTPATCGSLPSPVFNSCLHTLSAFSHNPPAKVNQALVPAPRTTVYRLHDTLDPQKPRAQPKTLASVLLRRPLARPPRARSRLRWC